MIRLCPKCYEPLKEWPKHEPVCIKCGHDTTNDQDVVEFVPSGNGSFDHQMLLALQREAAGGR